MLVEEYGLWIRANDEGSVTATKLSKHSPSVPSSKQLTSSQLRPSSPVTAGHKHDTQRTLPVINSVSSVSSTVSSSAVSSVSSATSPSSPLPDVSVLAPVCFLSFCSASSFSSFGILPLFRSCVYQRHPVPSSILYSFYRATACNAMHGIAVAILSVCLSVCSSVCHMRGL